MTSDPLLTIWVAIVFTVSKTFLSMGQRSRRAVRCPVRFVFTGQVTNRSLWPRWWKQTFAVIQSNAAIVEFVFLLTWSCRFRVYDENFNSPRCENEAHYFLPADVSFIWRFSWFYLNFITSCQLLSLNEGGNYNPEECYCFIVSMFTHQSRGANKFIFISKTVKEDELRWTS